ncbi:MAG: hypothetical protein FJX60_12210 [Alphaproteobacteria bacterium]|nr:hypothetical protein [Alphaproteobacteria bacterium]
MAIFIDENAAFVAQKGIYEYSRARAGHYAKVLFREAEFRDACDRSRWRTFPLGLAMVAEVVESVLSASRPEERQALVEAVRRTALVVFDRHPVHAGLGAVAWKELREELDRNLARIGLHPPKRAMDIPAPYAERYVGELPIHETLRGRDAPTIHNYLRVTMCNIHDELTKRIDVAAVAEAMKPPGHAAA